MSDQPNTPEILEATWDNAQVEALFVDLLSATESDDAKIDHVQVRTTDDRGPGQDRAMTLAEALTLFQSRAAIAIQIRYQYDGQTWCDTLMVGESDTRVVRTAGAIRP